MLGALGACGNFGLEWAAGKASWGAGAVPEAVLKLATLRSRDNQVRLKRHQALKEEKVLGTASVSWYS